jgi:3-isopropylmalate dehydrogenase
VNNDGAFRVAVVPGDGIGPEVVAEAMKCLDAVVETYRLDCSTTTFPHGAEHYLATGEVLSDESFADIAGHDAILFGATGDPRLPNRLLGRGILFRLSRELGLDLSVRPVRLYAPELSPLQSPTISGNASRRRWPRSIPTSPSTALPPTPSPCNSSAIPASST